MTSIIRTKEVEIGKGLRPLRKPPLPSGAARRSPLSPSETVSTLEALKLMSPGIVNSYSYGAQACLSNTPRDLAERDFVKVADASPEMIWMADMNGVRTFSNRTWLEFRGITSQQDLGSGWTEGIHAEDKDQCLREYWAAFGGPRAFRLDYRTLAADGSYHQIEQSGHPWFESSG